MGFTGGLRQHTSAQSSKKALCEKILIDLTVTDDSYLPYSLVSMLTHSSISITGGDYIPMFSEMKLFLVDPRLHIKVVFHPTAHES